MQRSILSAVLWSFLALITLALASTSFAAGSEILVLSVNKGQVLQLPEPATTIFVANPEVLDFHVKSADVVYVYAKKMGETTLYATNKSGKVIASYNVQVKQSFSELQSVLAQVFPGSRVSVTSVGETVILRGVLKNASEAEQAKTIAVRYVGDAKKIVNLLHVSAPTQVNLRVQVLEMSRTLNRALGVNWNATFGNTTNGTINPVLMPGELLGQAGTGGAVTPATAVNFLGNITGKSSFNLQAQVSLLESKGLVTILSEPNLTALSGQTASFLAGGEFPILIPQGNGTISIDFKKFGVSLAFTPTILDNGKINLQVRPEVSQLSNNGAVSIAGTNVPAITTRRADTTVELQSGQSFAIAGLLQNNANKLINQLPGLGDIPILGALFRSEQFQRDETELAIIVTPYLVQPTASDEISSPFSAVPAEENRKADEAFNFSANTGFVL